jgi:uncharacterized membrane protein
VYDSPFAGWHDLVGGLLALALGALYLAEATRVGARRGFAGRGAFATLGFGLCLMAPPFLWSHAALARGWLLEGAVFTALGLLPRYSESRSAGLAAFVLAAAAYSSSWARGAADPAFVSTWALTGLAASVGPAIWSLALGRARETARWEKGVAPILFLASAFLFLGWGTAEIQRFYNLLGDLARWALARDLTVSGFWMAYAGALLATGFRLRGPLVRWAGLGMALIAAAKVFVYDLSVLSRLYRIGSFVLLACVLLVLSFGYQRLIRAGSRTDG